MLKISKIILYDEPSVPELNLDDIVEFLARTFGISVEKKESITSMFNDDSIYHIAASRIQELRTPFQKHDPTSEEINFESESISESNQNITYYDGFELQNALGRIIPEAELADDIFHIIFTNKLTCTYDCTDYRYHGRALVCSNPSLISTTGIVEAPAKPREYYVRLMEYFRLGLNVDVLKEKFHGQFLEYHDSRLSKIARGYILQAIFYYETGEAFCNVKDCVLFNAHWQSDLLYSQLEVGRLCSRHQDVLKKLIMT